VFLLGCVIEWLEHHIVESPHLGDRQSISQYIAKRSDNRSDPEHQDVLFIKNLIRNALIATTLLFGFLSYRSDEDEVSHNFPLPPRDNPRFLRAVILGLLYFVGGVLVVFNDTNSYGSARNKDEFQTVAHTGGMLLLISVVQLSVYNAHRTTLILFQSCGFPYAFKFVSEFKKWNKLKIRHECRLLFYVLAPMCYLF
jgi:hypothetical protein